MQCNAPALGVELRDMGTKALLLAGVPAVTVQISCIANLFCSAVAALILSKQNRPAHRLQSFEHETLVQLPWFHVAQQPGLHACQAPARRVTIVMRRSQKLMRKVREALLLRLRVLLRVTSSFRDAATACGTRAQMWHREQRRQLRGGGGG